ncbi:ABC transporter substrate-binding protein [soil metagenome]
MRTSIIKHLTTAVAVVAIAAGLVACKGEKTSGNVAATTITVGVQRGPSSFDPLRSVWGGQYQMYMLPVYETLIKQKPDGTYAPGLATEWGYVDSTKLKFQLKLRENVKFSDGATVVNAAAVKQNLDRLTTVTGPMTGELASTLKAVEAPDDKTVIIELSKPNPDLERIISQVVGMIVNPNALKDGDALARTPAGAGPYVLDTAATIVNDTYVFTKNSNYYAADTYAYEKITMKIYSDPNAMLTALQSGVAQLGYGSPDNVDAAQKSGLQVVTQPTNVFHIVLSDRNGELSPALKDQRVRQALNYAVDRDAILKTVYRGQGSVTGQIFGPNTEAFDPALKAYAYDPAKARQLLADAGYPNGFTFSIAVFFPQRDNDYVQAVADYLSKVGVTMNIASLAGAPTSADVVRKHSAFVNGYGGQGAYTDARTLFLTSGTVFNAFGTVDPELSGLWDKASAEADPAARKAGFQALGKAVTDKAWFLPTTVVNAVAYYRADALKDIKMTPGVTVPLFYELQKK